MRIALIAAAALAAGPGFAATPVAGADAFNAQCGGCHSLDAASSPVAPSLKGVVGRRIAALPDFQYSDALEAKGGTWTPAALDAFIADPQAFAPGTAMPVSTPDRAQRQAIIDYLKTAR
ncbi:MAG TPA: c-type cytochrome [Caulobacteraceae bacterium]|nr:c-type cytochrome [Caulobacteraceae bacterium]